MAVRKSAKARTTAQTPTSWNRSARLTSVDFSFHLAAFAAPPQRLSLVALFLALALGFAGVAAPAAAAVGRQGGLIAVVIVGVALALSLGSLAFRMLRPR